MAAVAGGLAGCRLAGGQQLGNFFASFVFLGFGFLCFDLIFLHIKLSLF